MVKFHQSAGLSIQDLFRQSRKSKTAFLDSLSLLTCDDLLSLLKREISASPEGELRSRSDLEKLKRAPVPSLEGLSIENLSEQNLQWLLLQQGFLRRDHEIILCRELPVSCKGEHAERKADLIAFDQRLQQPILVELKKESAKDMLTGSVLELLNHWTFIKRHEQAYERFLNEFSCFPTAPWRLVLAAPKAFYTEARRRSGDRKGEYEMALRWIRRLAQENLLIISLYQIDLEQEDSRLLTLVTEPLGLIEIHDS